MVKIVISPVGHERTNLPDRMGQSFCTNAVQQWSVSELCVVFFFSDLLQGGEYY